MSDGGVEAAGATVRAEGGASISDLTYRTYDGPLKARFVRWWVVAQSGLRQTWGQWWFFMIASLPLIRFLMAGLFIFLRTQLADQVPGGLPNYPGEPDGQHFALPFWSVLCGDTNSMLLLVIALVAGAGCIAADNRANALLVYFSKPIGKLDYLVGKWMSIFLTLAGVTLVPAALLYLFGVVSYRDEGFLTSEPWLGPHLLLAALIPAVVHASLIVGISAWSKSPRIVAAIYVSLYMISWALAPYVGGILYKNHPEIQNIIRHCSVRGLIIGIDQNILHVVVPEISIVSIFQRGAPFSITEIPKLWPLATVAGALVIASISAAWLKIRAVEVVRG